MKVIDEQRFGTLNLRLYDNGDVVYTDGSKKLEHLECGSLEEARGEFRLMFDTIRNTLNSIKK